MGFFWDWDFLGFFGIFWDFLGFLNFQIGIGFFWDWDFLGFFGFFKFPNWDWVFLGFFLGLWGYKSYCTQFRAITSLTSQSAVRLAYYDIARAVSVTWH